MVNAVSGHKNPAGASVYGTIAGDAVSSSRELYYPLIWPFWESFKCLMSPETFRYSFSLQKHSRLGNANSLLLQWYRAQIMLQDQKMGHYMHIPPRAVFFSQIFGSFIGVPINYGVIRWVLNTKSEFLSGREIDPAHQWTAQTLAHYLTSGVQYVLIVSITSHLSCKS